MRVVNFLGKSLSDEQLDRLVEHLRFDKFTTNDSVNYEICKDLGIMNQTGRFLRKGFL